MFAFTILGMNLFGGKFNFKNAEGIEQTSRSNFDNFLWATITVFQVSGSLHTFTRNVTASFLLLSHAKPTFSLKLFDSYLVTQLKLLH